MKREGFRPARKELVMPPNDGTEIPKPDRAGRDLALGFLYVFVSLVNAGGPRLILFLSLKGFDQFRHVADVDRTWQYSRFIEYLTYAIGIGGVILLIGGLWMSLKHWNHGSYMIRLTSVLLLGCVVGVTAYGVLTIPDNMAYVGRFSRFVPDTDWPDTAGGLRDE